MNEFHHTSVLDEELLNLLDLKPEALVIDCTLGGGGHSGLILKKLSDRGRLIALDRDKNAIIFNSQRFEKEIRSFKMQLVHTTFSNIRAIAQEYQVAGKLDAIIADLGVSSVQIDQGDRGFSFVNDGPLDMRMNQEQTITADDIINHFEESDLAQLFYDLGEEPMARYYAKKIVARRQITPFKRTGDLASFVSDICPYKDKSRRHPALRLFQALRIKVNDELGEIERLLNDSFELLAPNGRLAVISFHSLEDRLVKQKFKALCSDPAHLNKDRFHLRHLPISEQNTNARSTMRAELIKPFPTIAGSTEISKNPRSRTAKLRVIKKILLTQEKTDEK